ncbi:MAG: SMP-30/gluconolactonase/LRE family protein [Betaproteobacteria bacterium]
MKPSPFTCVLDVRASLGECPIWAADEDVLYWVDINAPSLNRYDPSTASNTAMPLPSSIGSFALRKGGGFVVALRDGIWLADAGAVLSRRVAAPPYDPDHHRFNDGRCDPQGRFVVGTMNEKRDANDAVLYRLDDRFALDAIVSGVTISNGLAWSPDAATMYHADTPAQTIRAFDYTADDARPSNPRVFAQWHGEGERPDGGAVDSAGNYWSSFYRGGKIVKLSPAGDVLDEYAVPAMCPTMCAFGGPDLRTLYVTSARQQRDAEELERLPQSGGIFSMRVDDPGLPEHRFRG